MVFDWYGFFGIQLTTETHVEGVWKPRDIDLKLEFHLKNDGNPKKMVNM